MVIWKDPENAVTAAGVNRRPVVGLAFQQEADELRRNPGEWAVIRIYTPEERPSAYNTVNGIKSGRLAAFRPPGAFDARTSTEQDEKGETVVYVYAVCTGAG